MQATSNNGTTQTQTHRSHGVGSNPDEGLLQQIPSELMGQILSNLTCGEQAVAMSAAPTSLRERVASHIPELSVEQLEVALKDAAREGRLDEAQALLDRYQMANIDKARKNMCICVALERAIAAGHLSIVRHILSNSQLGLLKLNTCLINALSHNQPQIFRAVAGYVNFSELLKSDQLVDLDELFQGARNSSPEMFRVITEVIGPYLTDEQFQNCVGCPRRISDSVFLRVDEPAGCLV